MGPGQVAGEAEKIAVSEDGFAREERLDCSTNH